MKVFETELPGVGRRYTLRFPSGGEFVIVVHNNGRRQTYWREDADGDSEPLFEITEAQARKISEIFDGTYFHPVREGLDDAFENARIKWIEVGDTHHSGTHGFEIPIFGAEPASRYSRFNAATKPSRIRTPMSK